MSLGLHNDIDSADKAQYEERQPLSRSPQLYFRQSLDVPERLRLDRRHRPQSLQEVADQLPGLSLHCVQEHQNFDFRKSKDGNTSPGDSGTEADDEKPLLKALTAPPLRPRKGLKSSRGYAADHFESPLPTPSLTGEEDTSKVLGSDVNHGRASARSSKKTGNVRAKTRRQRAGKTEILRRLLEISLSGIVAYICLRKRDTSVLQAIIWHVAVITSLVFISWFTSVTRLDKLPSFQSLWKRLEGLLSADPAPLLYPVFLPILVASSLEASNRDALITNFILSLSALPKKAIPFENFNIHWILSITPILSSVVAEKYGLPLDPLTSKDPVSKSAIEELILLYPLHFALLHTLTFLTTTSLLPAEVQLLSVSLINLLYFGSSSQSLILKGLLWVGGPILTATCRHVLSWSVELARVPNWRLQRRKRRNARKSTLLCALNDTFGGWVHRIIKPESRDASSDEGWTPNPSRKQYSGSIGLVKSKEKAALESVYNDVRTRTSIDDSAFRETSPLSLDAVDDRTWPASQAPRRRRHTLPTNTNGIPDIPALTRTATDALSSAKVRSKLLLRLTPAQATVLKWLYALYVYLMAIAIIVVPLRLFIGYSALNNSEPFGWALGYLFGDLDAFRLKVVVYNLERWICLPQRHTGASHPSGFADQLRFCVLGMSNTRLIISAWCIINIAVGLAVVFRLSNIVEVDTRRKVFHGMMVSMFLPAIFIDPTFVSLAFVLILAIFLLLDLFRASQLPPVSKPLTYFLAPYVDGRDHRGPFIISHIFLLIGCAIPLWLSLADVERRGEGNFRGWDVEIRGVSLVTGVICVGMGDAAASLIGRRYGRRRWPWSGGKSLEGSLAFAVAVIIGLMGSRAWLLFGGWEGDSGDSWPTTWAKAAIAACGASLTEAVLTGGNDNVVVPVILWLLVRGLDL